MNRLFIVLCVSVITILCGFILLNNGCFCNDIKTINNNSLSSSWKARDFHEIDTILRTRCAAVSSQDKEDFRLIQEMILAGDFCKFDMQSALQVLATIAFSYCDPESSVGNLRAQRLQQYEKVILELLSDPEDPRYYGCLFWLYSNQNYVTKQMVDSILDVTLESKDNKTRKLAITFLTSFFGFEHAGFFFSDDCFPGGIKAFPLEQVIHYWHTNHEKVMRHKENLMQYARMGYYHDTGVVFAQTLPVASYTPPSDMKLLPSQFPFE